MSDTARDFSINEPATTVGMDEIFETVAQPLQNSRAPLSDGLTFKQACEHYALKPTALRSRIKSGEVAAEKVEGANGPEWRVYPEAVAQPFREAGVTLSQPVREVFDTRILDLIENLQSKLDKAQHELQAANYRVGYLENQVFERERDIQELDGTVKLLTDSQHKPGWWAKFSSWFFKVQ